MNSPRTVAIIQARMSSSRLPGKVLQEIAGKPMLEWVALRAARARGIQQVVVATTTDPSDDAVEAACAALGPACYRGSLYDVLDRYYTAARAYNADVVVRLTADCPLIDPGVIERTLDEFFASGADFAANRLPPPWKRTYPIGLDVEVCRFAALERAWREAAEKYEREHVMPYLYDQPGRFVVRVVDTSPDYGHLRWTVDTPADLEFVRRVVALLDGDTFTWLDVLAAVEAHPEISQINADVRHKIFNEVDERSAKKD
jgi:spore coat polysaccharide biosynthesis protein SpsF